MELPQGRLLDVSDMDSLASCFAGGQSRCGVYRIRFSNGDAYCGQTKDMVTRFNKHHRTYDDIVAVEFFPMSEKDLNEAERALISESERDTSLRNVMLTGRPRGEGDAMFVSVEGKTIKLPWDKERAKGAAASLEEATDKKFLQLLSHPQIDLIRYVLGWYISETIPDPAASARQLWTVSCMPSTSRTKTQQRLLTLSCGNLEVLYIIASRTLDVEGDDYFVEVVINTSLDEEPEKLFYPEAKAFSRWFVENGQYQVEEVTRFAFPLQNLALLIDKQIEFPQYKNFLAAAYELNVRLMRRGSTMYSRFHHERLADLLIAEAAIWDANQTRAAE
ncbi:GIY-YIG nuclease family protein [Corynebacterium sp. ACRPH]|uniref:GIY-YIG nuclease family protein n=1 Tax=Corynebacterium sp. ACRPH TaxID=2918199 RepID=UPI001EF3406C|nr:GIY-YIG nuclease family protein [Corynebacterium sp. ACRPH]MCG7455675.1 GIY-YIG nuclease family protein [Corynebacterium sp. ACRPH]